jgi:hypothetical protein
VAVPLHNKNSSMVTTGTFGADTQLYGLDKNAQRKLEELAKLREAPKVLSLANWLSLHRLIKFQVCTIAIVRVRIYYVLRTYVLASGY